MPHAISMPSVNFQALILCGPGASLSTFTTNPEEFPKALIPIANRPMIWYPLDWCYRMGVTDITLITPPSSAKAIEAALSQNPHLTSLPSPKADILAPEGLDQTSGTAEILRLPQVRSAITRDFIILPCDLVCELDGEALIEAWMVKQSGLGGVSGWNQGSKSSHAGFGGESHGRRGGLGVYFETEGEGSTKREETDFIITAPLARSREPFTKDSLVPNIQELVYSTTKDTLEDIKEEHKSFPLRHSLADKHPRTKILNTYRDAHIYLFPYWVLDMIKKTPKMESISEDVLGLWAKAGWQKGFATKLGLKDVLRPRRQSKSQSDAPRLESEINLADMSTTWTVGQNCGQDRSDSAISASQGLSIPPFLAYIQPRSSSGPLIRRVDTAQLLLYVSLKLAKLDSIEEVGKHDASPFAHASKIAYPAGVAQKTTINKADCLLAENITIESKAIIKESVLGANCHIKTGAKLTRCVLMDGAVIGERCELTDCIIGRRAQVGSSSILIECQVQEGNVIPTESDAKGQNFMIFEGLDTLDDDDDDDENDDDGEEETAFKMDDDI